MGSGTVRRRWESSRQGLGRRPGGHQRILHLSAATLPRLGRAVSVPRYDRRALRPSVVHVSVGSFHRSHQAVYFDDLARLGHTDWGLTGVGLRRRDMAEALLPQDCLYTVVERGADGDRPRVIGVMTRYLLAPESPQAVVDALADPRTKLLTLTVTSAAYEPAAPAPFSAIGLIVEALDRRRRARRDPFTVLSCDNLPANGDVTRQAVLARAAERDGALARWIEAGVAFPNCMVDRITPRTTDADRERLRREFGVVDRWPVMTEPFSDWVIEDSFCAGRPPLDEVGARFVADVAPYSLAKTRLLNASHLLLGALGIVAGVGTMPELMRDPVFHAYADAVMGTEIAPSLPQGAMDLEAYRHSLLERLANPAMEDQLTRLCRSAAVKLGRHVVPSLLTAREQGRPHPLLTVGAAAVCRLLSPGTDPRPLLADAAVFGRLGQDAAFASELEQALLSLEREGSRAAVARALAADELLTT